MQETTLLISLTSHLRLSPPVAGIPSNDNIEYTEHLADTGNPVTLINEPDQLHGFPSFRDTVGRAGEVWAEVTADLWDTFEH